MSALTTFGQHCTGGYHQGSQACKKYIRYPDWKEGSKNYLFTDDMILYMEDPKKSKEKLLKLVSVAILQGRRLNIQKFSFIFIHLQ